MARQRLDSDPGSPPSQAALPKGRHGLSPEFVARSQRERAIAALTALSAERGYRTIRVADIVGRARIARVTFYEHFRDKEDLFLAAFEDGVERLYDRVVDAALGRPGLPEALASSLGAALEFLQREPSVARLCLLEAPSVGEPIADRYRHALRRFARLLHHCRPESDPVRDLPDSTEDVLVAGAVYLIGEEIASRGSPKPVALLPDLVEFVLSRYLGPVEASRQAARLTRLTGSRAVDRPS